MRPINYYYLALLSAILLINNGCSEENPPSIFNGKPLLDSTPPPEVGAPSYIQVLLPKDFCMIYTSYSLRDGQTSSSFKWNWKKIAGPTTFTIDNPNTPDTKVSNLVKGVYEFEISMTDERGQTAKDTTTVTVGQMSSNPKVIIVKDLIWNDDGWNGFYLDIKDFKIMIGKSVFKIYIQRENTLLWKEVLQYDEDFSATDYYFQIDDRNVLLISYFGATANDRPSVKIEYTELE
jgi:hypothetical protein